MTGFSGSEAAERDWDRMAALGPEALDALAGLVAAAWRTCDPTLLELVRLRIAVLLGNVQELDRRSEVARRAGVTEIQVADLAAWPTSPHFSAGQRAGLALAEQFVVDANGVTDAMVNAARQHLGDPGTYAFVEAVSALETYQRACLTLGIHDAPGVDEILAGPPSPTEVPL